MTRPRRTSTASEVSTVPEQHQELGSMYDYLAKVILLGPSGSGKSCILHRFVKSEWRVLSSQTIGVEFSSKIIKIGTGPTRRRVKLQLWDTAGTERFRSVSRSYYRGAAGAILVYDVASLSSFNALPTFLMDARALASPNLMLILAGNKVDLTDGSTSSSQQYHHYQQQQSQRSDAIPSSTSSRTSLPPPDSGGGGAGGWGDPLSTSPAFPGSTAMDTIHEGDGTSSSGGAGSGTGIGGGMSAGFGNSVNTNSNSNSSRSRVGSITAAATRWTATTSMEGREVSPDLATRWASRSGVPVVMDVSALTGENVDEVFARLARMILAKIELGEIDPGDPQSGIQYGDLGGGGGGGGGTGGGGGGAWDGGSIHSGLTLDEPSVRRRRKGGGAGRGGMLGSLGEFGDVFRKPGSGRGGCC